MPTIIVSIICIAMIVIGGMSLSQGILTSADSASLSVDEITLRESETARTSIEVTNAAQLTWSDMLRVNVLNTGQTKQAYFEKWDFIVRYSAESGNIVSEWFPYTTASCGGNEWELARIGLNGPIEFFEPGILNPLEEAVLLARPSPLPDSGTVVNVTLATPNGVYDSKSFSYPGYTVLTPQRGDTNISATSFYLLNQTDETDGDGLNMAQQYIENESGRKLLYNENQPSQPARFVFPLVGIERIPASRWTIYYRCLVSGSGQFPREDNDVRYNADILIRQADGTIRATIGSEVAEAYIDEAEEGIWLTKNATYDFPGYIVEDDDDYLEINYYIASNLGPNSDSGYVLLRIDDATLEPNEMTRIEG